MRASNTVAGLRHYLDRLSKIDRVVFVELVSQALALHKIGDDKKMRRIETTPTQHLNNVRISDL